MNKSKFNKKVLLRERKRHTDRGVSSTTEVRYPPLSGYPPARSDGGRGYLRWGTPPVGVPPSGLTGGVPKVGCPLLGYPPARSDRGYPRWGTPIRVSPSQVQWYPTLGTPHWTWLGYPPPPPQVWRDRRTDTSQNITFLSYYVRGR